MRFQVVVSQPAKSRKAIQWRLEGEWMEDCVATPFHLVEVPRGIPPSRRGQSKSALKLVELGPRMSMQLVKVEQGLGEGNVMFHAFVQKTPEEAKEIQERKEVEARLKKERREEQERNVERKRKKKEEKREAKRLRKKERNDAALDELRRKEEIELEDDNEDDADIEDLLAEYTTKGTDVSDRYGGDEDIEHD